MKVLVSYGGSRQWVSWLEDFRTHQKIVDEISRMADRERRKRLGPILSVTTGSCNFNGVSQSPERDICITFLPTTPSDLEAAQPALRLVVELHDEPQYSIEALMRAHAASQMQTLMPGSWDDLPISVVDEGEILELLMTVDHKKSLAKATAKTVKGKPNAAPPGTGYVRVKRLIAGTADAAATGEHIGYKSAYIKGESTMTARFVPSQRTLAYPNAKAALIAVATHVARCAKKNPSASSAKHQMNRL